MNRREWTWPRHCPARPGARLWRIQRSASWARSPMRARGRRAGARRHPAGLVDKELATRSDATRHRRLDAQRKARHGGSRRRFVALPGGRVRLKKFFKSGPGAAWFSHEAGRFPSTPPVFDGLESFLDHTVANLHQARLARHSDPSTRSPRLLDRFASYVAPLQAK